MSDQEKNNDASSSANQGSANQEPKIDPGKVIPKNPVMIKENKEHQSRDTARSEGPSKSKD